MGGPVFACISPHPPIIVPAVGRGSERAAQATIDALHTLRDRLAPARPDTIVLICPHGPVTVDHCNLLTGPLAGDLGRFGAGGVRFRLESDAPLAAAFAAEAARRGLALRPVARWNQDDHSAWVPLWFLQEAAPAARVLAVSISPATPHEHYMLGRALARALERGDQRVAIIASADGSHALSPEGPYGFHEAAPKFEALFHQAVRAWDVDAVLAFEERFRREAAEDCVPSVAFLMGTLSHHQVQPTILSAEAPWGVGYLTAIVEIGPRRADAGTTTVTHTAIAGGSSPEIVQVARAAVEHYLHEGRRLQPQGLRDQRWLQERAATFVSLFEESGALRGCVGSVQPTQPHIAAEVVANAIAAAVEDPRFLPVRAEELPSLQYKVDILTPPEPVADEAHLDPARYGVIVEAGPRRGLLLPALEGIFSVAEQVAAARRKAGIAEQVPVTLYRFEVERFSE